MSKFNYYYSKNVEAYLSTYMYYDYGLSHDYSSINGEYIYENIINNSNILKFDFNNTGTTSNIVSLSGYTYYGGNYFESMNDWSGSTTSGFTISDIGLNSYNLPLTGQTLSFVSGDTKFKMYPINISGSPYEFPLLYNSDYSGNFLEFGGGFIQGFYGLHGYPYNLIPDRFIRGWTANFILKNRFNNNLFSGYTGTTLNDDFSDNNGIFFYWGTKSENKFWNEFSGDSSFFTSEGISLNPNDEVVRDFSDNDNGFRYFYTKCGDNNEIILENNNCPETGVTNNVFALRINEEGKLGYRMIRIKNPCDLTYSSGSCLDNIFIEENYTEESIFTGSTCTPYIDDNGVRVFGLSEWIDVTVKWERDYPYANECKLKYGKFNNGTLKFYVNARPVLKITGFTEFIPYELFTDRSKQQSVPYNMSLGGGSLGLLNNLTFSGSPYEYTNDVLDNNLLIERYFAGTFMGAISQFNFYDKPLDFTEIRYNFNKNKDRYRFKGDFGGSKIFLPNNSTDNSNNGCEGNCSDEVLFILSDNSQPLTDQDNNFITYEI